MSAISCSRSFCRSSRAFRSSSRLGARQPRLCLWWRPHMVTSLLRVVEKRVQAVAQPLDRGKPDSEQLVALGGQRVGALRRAWQLGAPFGRDETVVLESAQRAIEVPDVDAILARELRQALDELVAVVRPRCEQCQQSRLSETLDARPYFPLAALGARAVSRSLSSSAMHCTEYMQITYVSDNCDQWAA